MSTPQADAPSLSEEQVHALAVQLDDAVQSVSLQTMLSASVPLSLADGYRVQRAGISLRKLRGDGLVGMKMGLTSRAKMEQMGVHNPIYGHLTQQMRLEDGGVLPYPKLCHPRVEPEVAFLLGRELRGPVSPAEALLCVEGVCAALEIIDSRYRDFKFTLPDVVADNASSSYFVLGQTVKDHASLDLGNLGMVMEINGVTSQIGSSAAIYEHPARSLATLANLVAELGESVPAGSVVLAGGATAAVALQPGDHVQLRVDGLRTASFTVSAAE